MLSCNREKTGSADSDTIYVTITPLRSIVEEITCGDFSVEVLVPKGASPETFEPTPRHLTLLNNAQLLFKVGLIDFEHSLTQNIGNSSKVVDLSQGITPMEGSCSHHHCQHHHGIDPHIWTAPRSLRTMAQNIRNAVMEIYPDSTKYDRAAQQLIERIEMLDAHCAERIAAADVKAMMIYHPAYTYYAQDYGIEQIAIEQDGKEPTPKQLITLLEDIKSKNISTIFYQPQYSEDKLRSIADQANVDIVVSDPLSEDIMAEIERITTLICKDDE
ncbi:MAG: zinc ABC transporter substrate-binding protein [Alistipes sp.]|nr:zinc ABC transporter substrate-binding protein [Alistipes sp.]